MECCSLYTVARARATWCVAQDNCYRMSVRRSSASFSITHQSILTIITITSATTARSTTKKKAQLRRALSSCVFLALAWRLVEVGKDQRKNEQVRVVYPRSYPDRL